MKLETVDAITRWAGGVLAYTTLGMLLYGIWRGTRRQAGRITGRTISWLRFPWFYLASSALFFGICCLAWKPLPQTFTPSMRAWMLAVGSLLYFPDMGLVLWGRQALGKNYFVSTGFSAPLFADHQLITNGPFAIFRHPMYTGLFFAALGSLLINTTWTTLLFACSAPLLIVRARREEAALAAAFGREWQDYCRRAPAFFPRLIKRK